MEAVRNIIKKSKMLNPIFVWVTLKVCVAFPLFKSCEKKSNNKRKCLFDGYKNMGSLFVLLNHSLKAERKIIKEIKNIDSFDCFINSVFFV